MSYYRDVYQFVPGFRTTSTAASEGYLAGLRYELGGDPTGPLAYTINVVGITGSSGTWAVWGHRDWEIGLLLTSEPEGPWLEEPVPWFRRDSSIRSSRWMGAAPRRARKVDLRSQCSRAGLRSVTVIGRRISAEYRVTAGWCRRPGTTEGSRCVPWPGERAATQPPGLQNDGGRHDLRGGHPAAVHH